MTVDKPYWKVRNKQYGARNANKMEKEHDLFSKVWQDGKINMEEPYR